LNPNRKGLAHLIKGWLADYHKTKAKKIGSPSYNAYWCNEGDLLLNPHDKKSMVVTLQQYFKVTTLC
jgi:hypothetical protein